MKLIPVTAAFLAFGLLASSVTAVPRGFVKSEETEGILEEDFTPKRGRFAPKRERKGGEKNRTARQSSAGFSWYAAHQKDGIRPPAPSGIVSLDGHRAYYIGPDEPVVYLTFDAGYENGNVAKILDTLKEEGVPGAFFILENLVNRNPELVERMAEEGHLVCNHTARHRDMTAFSKTEFMEELGRMEAAYKNLTGRDMAKYYRPPEGRFTAENLDWAQEMGYSTVLWSFAYADWDNEKQPDPDASLAKILSGAHNGMVLLLHPTSETNARILPALIRGLRDLGYRFGTLDELDGRRMK